MCCGVCVVCVWCVCGVVWCGVVCVCVCACVYVCVCVCVSVSVCAGEGATNAYQFKINYTGTLLSKRGPKSRTGESRSS